MLVSHRLTELAANSDRVAIILDGKCVRVLEGAERTAGEHRGDARARPRRRRPPAGGGRRVAASRGRRPGLELAGVTDHAAACSATSTSRVRSGRVTALVGVEGSGGREIVRACGGLRRIQGHVTRRRQRDPSRQRAPTTSTTWRPTARRASSRTSPSARTSSSASTSEISRGILGIRRRGDALDRRGAARRASRSSRPGSTSASAR